LVAFNQIIKFPNFKKNICLHWFFLERNKCVEKIKACKQKLSELKKYENIIKKKHVKKLIIFFKSKKKSETLRPYL
jgi:hypothetical protein